jgi:16S rRNA (adenine1518-N6/adenine1519-N6)-dimethyltransferase
MYVRPKKRLGQHFLTDMSVAQRIAAALSVSYCNKTLEIGPGTGVLTQFLLAREDLELCAVEVDSESVEYLKVEFPQLNLIEADFLEMNFEGEFFERFNVVGNFPYNISSQIFFRILENRNRVPEVVCMLQREVAVRLAAGPGGRDYGILSVLLQTYYDIEYLFTVSEGVFNPPPKVKSGVIRLVRNSRTELPCDELLFFKIVKATFNQRRKTIRNSLKSLFPQLSSEHKYYSLRPEVLSCDQFIELTQWVENQIKN